MYIISKFHDYYDTAIGYGIDKDCVYNRDLTTLDHKGLELSWRETKVRSFCTSYRSSTTKYRGFLLGFCGKIMPVLEETTEGETKYHYDSSTVDFNIGRWDRKRKDAFFDLDYTRYGNIFREYNVPIFILGNKQLILNPCLKDIDFMRIKDPYTCFQEIFMYKSGVLGNPEKDIIEISDKDKIKQHGFDNKSFKKEKKKV